MMNQKKSFVQFLFVKLFFIWREKSYRLFSLKILLERIPFFQFENTFGEKNGEHKPICQIEKIFLPKYTPHIHKLP